MLKQLGLNIKAKRKASSLTQATLAQKAGVHVNAIKLIETGKRWPRLDTLVDISTALHCTPSQLLFSAEDVTRADAPSLVDVLKLLSAYQAAKPLRRAFVMSVLTCDLSPLDSFPAPPQELLTALKRLKREP